MAKWFVSRHPGAVSWAKKNIVSIDHYIEQLDISVLNDGDIVIGVLPVAIIAKLNEMGIRFFALSMNLSLDIRGKELSSEQMEQCQCTIEEFNVTRVYNSNIIDLIRSL